jgi:hypothetical protein
MSLSRALDAQLDAPVAGAAEAKDGGRSVEVEVVQTDRLAARVKAVCVSGGNGDVPGQAARLPGELRGVLPERLEPVEVAPGLGGAILRSEPGDIRDREFFEVRTDGRSTTLERLRVTATGRERVPFTLSREALGQVVDGMERATAPPR